MELVICKKCLNQCERAAFEVEETDEYGDNLHYELVHGWYCATCESGDQNNMLFVGFNQDAPL